MASIEFKNISKSFNKEKVLAEVTFHVEEGTIFTLLGPSGCGKTTSLKLIAGLIQPDSGDILLNSTSLLSTPIEKRETILVFQDNLLFPHMSLYDNIAFGLKMKKCAREYIKTRVDEMVEIMELSGLEHKYPKELSGGQKQRGALARGLAVNPKILLLDEPFSSLDYNLKISMRELLKKIQKKLKITTILVTHDKEEALMLSDKIALMLKGKVHQIGTPYDIYERPNSVEVANFFGERNYIKGTITDNTFISSIGSFNLHGDYLKFEGNTITAMIKEEDVSISLDDESKFFITEKSYGGDKFQYVIRCDENIIKCTTSKNVDLSINSKVSLVLNPKNLVFFD
jgi:ABC-type Fe3+/spermidine/putrescine transport system ATPase subunit